jgi:hypothetical protein
MILRLELQHEVTKTAKGKVIRGIIQMRYWVRMVKHE